ncbi:methionyl-tRNA formyltransferase [Candidatus Gracilibacteria bacterium]|nr:methionyl-tRNA formyltransferase [Candidatus Gracilibacteria bacterium]
MIRIGFFGTPYLAKKVLEDIGSRNDFEVAFAVTNPDKPVGRREELVPTPVKVLAQERNIPVYTPTKIRGNMELLEELQAFECDYFVVIAYGRILPIDLLRIPKKKCINIHGSMLPLYRGASPIQSVLLNGESETGVTIMEMSEGMDEGDILKIVKIPINSRETSETLFQKFAEISGQVLIQTLLEIEHGGITSLPQEHDKATYCTKIEKEDGKISFSKSAVEIYHMWQAYTPWPGIYTTYEGKRLLLEDVGYTHASTSVNPGRVIQLEDGTIGIQCLRGILTLNQVKLEGKKSQSIKDFINGKDKFISSLLL